MKNLLPKLLFAVVVLGAATAPGLAADSKTVVKVALLDMSSVASSNLAGHNMMGQGWGPEMMGYGMMRGMMSIRIDQSTVKAGTVTFDVTNWSRGMLHDMLIVSIADPSAPLPYDYNQARVAKDQIKILGETSDMEPSASKTVDISLAPGTYLLICNVPGHYASGMAVPLTVSQ